VNEHKISYLASWNGYPSNGLSGIASLIIPRCFSATRTRRFALHKALNSKLVLVSTQLIGNAHPARLITAWPKNILNFSGQSAQGQDCLRHQRRRNLTCCNADLCFIHDGSLETAFVAPLTKVSLPKLREQALVEALRANRVLREVSHCQTRFCTYKYNDKAFVKLQPQCQQALPRSWNTP